MTPANTCNHLWSNPSKYAPPVECLYCGAKKVVEPRTVAFPQETK